MSKKVLTLCSSVIGGIATVSTAVVTFINPAYATAIVSAIGIGTVAIVDILTQFVKTDTTE